MSAGRSEMRGRDAGGLPSGAAVTPAPIVDLPGDPDRAIVTHHESIQLTLILLRYLYARAGRREVRGGDPGRLPTRPAIAPPSIVDFPGDPDRAVIADHERVQLMIVLLGCGHTGPRRGEMHGRDAGRLPARRAVTPPCIADLPGDVDGAVMTDHKGVELLVVLL